MITLADSKERKKELTLLEGKVVEFWIPYEGDARGIIYEGRCYQVYLDRKSATEPQREDWDSIYEQELLVPDYDVGLGCVRVKEINTAIAQKFRAVAAHEIHTAPLEWEVLRYFMTDSYARGGPKSLQVAVSLPMTIQKYKIE